MAKICNLNNNNVLREFLGRKEINGTKRKYWIEVATEEYFDEIINEMTSGFVTDEPLSGFAGLINCKESIAFMRVLYKKYIEQNLTLICLTTNADGKPTLAGMNVTFVAKNDDEECKPVGEVFTKIYNLLDYVSSLNDPFEKLEDCDRFLYAMGLYVLPDYRGEGLGLELLKAREPLCKMNNIRYTCTVFTSIISQKVADRAGFKDLVSIPYKELFERKPELTIPKILEHTKNCRLMYIDYNKF